MDKYIYDESNGLWYELQEDYYIPCLVLPTEKENKRDRAKASRPWRYLFVYRKYISHHRSGRISFAKTKRDMVCRSLVE